MSDQTQEQTADAGTAPQQTSLQLSDILLCAQVIQLASSRGAFRAEEFSQIGSVYDRVIAFLKDSGALQPAPSADATPAADAPAAQ